MLNQPAVGILENYPMLHGPCNIGLDIPHRLCYLTYMVKVGRTYGLFKWTMPRPCGPLKRPILRESFIFELVLIKCFISEKIRFLKMIYWRKMYRYLVDSYQLSVPNEVNHYLQSKSILTIYFSSSEEEDDEEEVFLSFFDGAGTGFKVIVA